MPRKILVVGAGVAGLTCAARLLDDGNEVVVLADREAGTSVSSVAGGLWYLPRIEPVDPRVVVWARRSYERFLALSSGETGIVVRECLELLRSERDLSLLADVLPGFRPARDDELLGGASAGFVSGPLPVIAMDRYLGWLVRKVRRNGRIGVRRFVHVTEAVEAARAHGFDAVVNATGFGAREFVRDESLVPIRGQVVRLEPVGLERVILDEDHPDGVVYLIPRIDDLVCGGLRLAGDASARIDPMLERAIVDRAASLEPRVRSARVVSRAAGVRPGRPSVRLGAESIGGIDVVHDYGHSGNGVTLSWGCADDVAALLR